MNEQRLKYRREILHTVGNIKNAANHDTIGFNELYKHGGDRITSGVLFGISNCSMNGAEIIKVSKQAIEHEQNESKKSRENLPKASEYIPSNTTLMEGEPFAMFGRKHTAVSENAFESPLKGLMNIFK